MAAEILLITASVMLAWVYLIYPAAIFLLVRLRRVENSVMAPPESNLRLPLVSVVMSLHNEEQVAEAKIDSMLNGNYPQEMIEFIIGSDGSDDDTETIARRLAQTDCRIKFFSFSERRGKAAVINDLVTKATGELLIVTDANVMFVPDTIKALAEAFTDPRTGLCDTSVSCTAAGNTGIAPQENLYNRLESKLKRAEGDLCGAMPGPYGGCYAVRRHLFPTLPENLLADDLYAGIMVLKKGYKSVNSANAQVYEDVQPDIMQQFKRRVRIAAGAYQNLFLLGPFPAPGVCANIIFFSHKVMRWMTPFILLLFFMTTVILSNSSNIYFCLLAIQLIFLTLSALDLLSGKLGKKIRYQRYITQFLLMNVALAVGFVKAVRGLGTGIWEPTKRVQDDRPNKATYHQ